MSAGCSSLHEVSNVVDVINSSTICNLSFIALVVDNRDDNSIQLFYRDVLDLSMLCQKLG